MLAAARETRVPGRMDVVGQDPLTVYDGAHNPSGAEALAGSLAAVLGDRYPRVAVIGVLEDKDAAAMLRALLPHFERVVFTRSRNPRSLSPGHAREPRREARAGDARPRPWATRSAAVDRARLLAGPGARSSPRARST